MSNKDQGNAAFKAKDYPTAIEFYTKAIEENPTDHTIYGNRAAAYQNSTQFDQAIQDADKCIELKSDWAKGYIRKGMALQAANKLHDAMEMYEAAEKCDHDAAQVEKLKDALGQEMFRRRQMGDNDDLPPNMATFNMPGSGSPFGAQGMAKAEADPKIAQWLKDDVQFRNMFEMCKQNPQMLMQLMQTDPRFMEVFKAMTGLDLGAMGAQRQAQQEQNDADLIWAQEQKKKDAEAEAARKQKEAEESMPSEDRQALENAREAEKKKLLGNDFYKKKQFPEAIEHYTAASELNPKELTYYSNLAAVYVEMGELDKAIECCDNAIEKAKEGNYDYVKLGKAKARKALCLFKQEKLDESIDMYKEALLEHNSYDIKQAKLKVEKRKKELAELAYLDPALAEQHKDKGNELFKAGDFPGAIKEFDEGVRRDPKNKFVYSNRCAAYLKLMDPVTALKDAEKALELDKEFVKAWARKGTAHQMSKEYHKALDAYKEGLKIDPNSKECIEGQMKTHSLINSSAHGQGGNDEERTAHAMADPEIQAIMMDPIIQQLLRDMSTGNNQASAMKMMQDPTISGKVQKLIAAGVIKTA